MENPEQTHRGLRTLGHIADVVKRNKVILDSLYHAGGRGINHAMALFIYGQCCGGYASLVLQLRNEILGLCSADLDNFSSFSRSVNQLNAKSKDVITALRNAGVSNPYIEKRIKAECLKQSDFTKQVARFLQRETNDLIWSVTRDN